MGTEKTDPTHKINSLHTIKLRRIVVSNLSCSLIKNNQHKELILQKEFKPIIFKK